MIACLRTRVRKQPIIALYFEFEAVLKFYNIEVWSYHLNQNIIKHYSLNLQNDMTPLIMSETPTSRKQTLDRGYPPQHTAASEQEYEQRRRETKLEHRDRRPYQTPMSPAESYNRPRDDPKQVSARYVIKERKRAKITNRYN